MRIPFFLGLGFFFLLPWVSRVEAQEKLNLKRLNDLYNPSEVSIGKKAPDFSAVDIHGDMHSLSQLQGKYVLIQVWSSAMDVCLREMPFWKKMKAFYGGKNIAFMSVSIDKSKADWVVYYSRNNLQGLELFTDAYKAPFSYYILKTKDEDRRHFLSYTLPQYILIGPNGTILDNRMKISPSNSGSFQKFIDGLPGLNSKQINSGK